MKDPRASDGRGQSIADTPEEVAALFDDTATLESTGLVVMPHIAAVTDRYSIGHIRLGPFGTYTYLGREHIIDHDNNSVYAGADLAVMPSDEAAALEHAAQTLEVPPKIIYLAQQALQHFEALAVYDGRVSVDILCGRSDNGQLLSAVVDITPRVGNNTPPEVEAIKALCEQGTGQHVAYASGQLYYISKETPAISKAARYIDTESLVSTAVVTDVIRVGR